MNLLTRSSILKTSLANYISSPSADYSSPLGLTTSLQRRSIRLPDLQLDGRGNNLSQCFNCFASLSLAFLESKSLLSYITDRGPSPTHAQKSSRDFPLALLVSLMQKGLDRESVLSHNCPPSRLYHQIT